ncbi:MAG: iron-containing alcohol dehydrogenase [Gemmataceae bacterium]
MRETWTFHGAGKLVFGRHAVNQLGEIVARWLRGHRVLIVTDPAMQKTGLLDQVRRPLLEKDLIVDNDLVVEDFTGGEPEPSMRAADECIALAKKMHPDVVIGLGGGSNMDLAKITATVLAHGGAPKDYIGDDKIPGPITSLVCIPTTAGTGSEVSAAAVLTDTENHIKVGILSNHLRPRVALVDPLLTVSCPHKVTADSGIDALTHAIEAYTAVDNAVFPLPPGERSVYQGKHPMGDMMAEKAIELVGQHLRHAVLDGQNIEAREGMALAATLAGLAFSNVGVAVVHALEYPVGGAVHCAHGAGNGLLLPYVMRFNLPARVEEFANIARLLGEDVEFASPAEAAERAITAVEKLKRDIGIPLRLRDIGVKEEQLRPFAEKAAGIQRILRVNPRKVGVDDLEGILKAAF